MTSFRRRATLKAKELEVVKFYHFQFSSTIANADIAGTAHYFLQKAMYHGHPR